MKAIGNRGNYRKTTCGRAGASTRRPGRSPRHFGSACSALGWLWLVVLAMALAANGCGGGDESGGGDEGESTSEAMPGPPTGPPPGAAAKKPKEKPEEKAAEEEVTLTDDVSEWKLAQYEKAKKDGDPRLFQAIAYLGENFAQSDHADDAAQVLRRLLEKTEGVEQAPTGQMGSPSGGYPGSGYPAMGPPGPGGSGGMVGSMGMGGYPGEEEEMEEEEENDMEEEDEGDMDEEGMDSGYPGSMGPGGYPGMGRGPGSRAAKSRSCPVTCHPQ